MSRRRKGTWAEYESAKRTWAAENPGASFEQYERACRAIARRLGL